MAKIIIYYSQGGTTDLIAKTLASNLNADLVRIHDLKNREGFANRLFSSINAFRETKTDIVPAKVDLRGYDTIYFGTPTWSGNPTPAILTIIDRCDLRARTLSYSPQWTATVGKAILKDLSARSNCVGQGLLKASQ